MAAERESMLIMKNVSKTFNPGTVNEKCALNGVNLTLGAGDFATIVGSNGAGKSTLFNAITGAFFPDRGLIMLGGEDITYQQEHVRSKVIGHLFQDPLKGTGAAHDDRGKHGARLSSDDNLPECIFQQDQRGG